MDYHCCDQFKLSLVEDYFKGPLVRSVGNALLESFIDDRDYHLIKMMIDGGFRLKTPIIRKCISTYDVEIYKLLYPKYISIREYMFNVAASKGDIELFKWLKSNHFYSGWKSEYGILAAENGHLDMLQWLVADGCPWRTYQILDVAARNGHLGILKWMYENGFPLESCHFYFPDNRHSEVIKWLIDQGCSVRVRC